MEDRSTYKTKKTQDLWLSRLAPQDLDAEMSVLGSIMLENDVLQDVVGIISNEGVFYKEGHKIIFGVILELFRAGSAIDMLTVSDRIRVKGLEEEMGGMYYLTEIMMKITSTAHAEAHARIVMEKYVLRELIRVSGEVITDSYNQEDPFAMIDKAHAGIITISESIMPDKSVSLADATREVLTEAEYMRNSVIDFSGVTTGMDKVNKAVHGWKEQDLIILAARPSVGKTAFALNLILNAAKSGVYVDFYSLEMSRKSIIRRLQANFCDLDAELIQFPKKMTNEQYERYISKSTEFSKLPIGIDDKAAINTLELRSKARKRKLKKGTGLIVVDYLQLMRSAVKSENRNIEIGQISRDLKAIAKDLNVPLIALSQLSRGIESRSDNKPKLSDLRESGSIEQDADLVMFLYRAKAVSEEEEKNPIQLINLDIAKFRDGTVGGLLLDFDRPHQRFTDYDPFRVDMPMQIDNPRAAIPNNYRSILPTEKDIENPF